MPARGPAPPGVEAQRLRELEKEVRELGGGGRDPLGRVGFSPVVECERIALIRGPVEAQNGGSGPAPGLHRPAPVRLQDRPRPLDSRRTVPPALEEVGVRRRRRGGGRILAMRDEPLRRGTRVEEDLVPPQRPGRAPPVARCAATSATTGPNRRWVVDLRPRGTDNAVSALEQAIQGAQGARGRVPLVGLVHHCDHGSKRLPRRPQPDDSSKRGPGASAGAVGSSYDNALPQAPGKPSCKRGIRRGATAPGRGAPTPVTATARRAKLAPTAPAPTPPTTTTSHPRPPNTATITTTPPPHLPPYNQSSTKPGTIQQGGATISWLQKMRIEDRIM